MRRRLRWTLAAVLLLPVLIACGGTQQVATTAVVPRTAAAPTAGASTTAPLATMVTASAATTSASLDTGGYTATSASSTTTAPALDTPTVPPPTVPPTITPAATATAFPLQAGWWDNSVCYEVFVRSFYDSNGDGIGDLNGLIQKLDYINDGNPKSAKSLGANCIWLMPIMESPSYHGYDITDYRTVNHQYGTNDDFKRLVSEAHKRGIKVLIDMVLNHTSVQHPWFKEAAGNPHAPHRDWYLWYPVDPGYGPPWDVTGHSWHKTPGATDYYYGIFDTSMPDLNYRNPAVIKEMEDTNRFWLQDMGADGFRLDAVPHLIEDGRLQQDTPETHALLRDYQHYIESVKRDVFTVGEVNPATASRLQPYYPDQLDEYFEFGLADAIIHSINGRNGGPLTTEMSNTLKLLPFDRFAPFLTNHDQPRAMSQLQDDMNAAKVAATALMTLPGLPFVYYGEEIGMLGNKPDEQIRTPLAWDNTLNSGGFTTGSPWETLQAKYHERNIATEDTDPQSLLNLYRKLIHLRTVHPVLAQGTWQSVSANAPGIAAYIRHGKDEDVLVLLNLRKQDQAAVGLSAGETALVAGQYNVTEALSAANATALTVGAKGAISNYVPLPTLKAETGYVFLLKK